MTNTYTYNILRAVTSPDEVEDMGEIDKETALNLINSFPFEEELNKRKEDTDLMVPTITFENNDENLAVWSEEVGKFTIWVPSTMVPVDNVTEKEDIEACITYFFENKLEELSSFIDGLAQKYAT